MSVHLESGRWQHEQWVAVEMGEGSLFELPRESKSRRRAVSHSLLPSQADEPDPTSRAHLIEQCIEGFQS